MSGNDQGDGPDIDAKERKQEPVKGLAERIGQRLSELRIRNEIDIGKVSRRLARNVRLWQAAGGREPGNLNFRFGAELQRGYAQELKAQAKDAQLAFDNLRQALSPSKWSSSINPADRHGPLGEFVFRAAFRLEVDVDDLNRVFRVIAEGIQDGETEGERLYREWLKDNSGNKVKEMGRLRRSLDGCIANEIEAIKTRARIIAATLVVSGVIEARKEASEIANTVQTLRDQAIKKDN